MVPQDELESYLGFWNAVEIEEALIIADRDWDLAHFVETEGFSHPVEKEEPSVGKIHVEKLHLVVFTQWWWSFWCLELINVTLEILDWVLQSPSLKFRDV